MGDGDDEPLVCVRPGAASSKTPLARLDAVQLLAEERPGTAAQVLPHRVRPSEIVPTLATAVHSPRNEARPPDAPPPYAIGESPSGLLVQSPETRERARARGRDPTLCTPANRTATIPIANLACRPPARDRACAPDGTSTDWRGRTIGRTYGAGRGRRPTVTSSARAQNRSVFPAQCRTGGVVCMFNCNISLPPLDDDRAVRIPEQLGSRLIRVLSLASPPPGLGSLQPFPL
ncbi:hypothetical protein C8Q77DRAFT_456703 [Trametes polyzona]|nr:hypothetical protein C8Q77DRAFT_456703 [Trametes polyzona]